VTRQNLVDIIAKSREKYPDVAILLVGMLVPPNMGEKYASEFRQIFSELARSQKTKLIPFLLDGVADRPELNLPDGNHPNAEGHKVVAENVWRVLEPLLKE
jgi:acyl-CoA thioesterase-1